MRRTAVLAGLLVVALAAAVGSLRVVTAQSEPFHDTAAEAISDPPSGGWTWFHEPRAVQHDGTIFYGYITGGGDTAIRTIDPETRATSAETILHAGMEADDHNNPTILIRESDQRVMVFYSRHGGAELYMRVSTDPHSIASFGPEVDLDPWLGGAAYTYPSPVQLDEPGDPIRLFFRDPIDDDTTALRYSTSFDGGATWDAQRVLYSDAGRSAYWKVASDGGRVDFAVSDGHPFYDEAVRIGHFYYEGGVYYRTDGSPIDGGLPFDFTDVAEVHDGNPTGWVWDVARDPVTGHPSVAYVTWPSRYDHRLHVARWNGSDWEATEVAPGGRGDLEPTTGMFYAGGIVLDHEDPDVAYASRETEGQFEMWRYTHDGASWVGEQITSDSDGMNIRPVSIRNHGPDLTVLWMFAPRYDTYLDYSAGTRGT